MLNSVVDIAGINRISRIVLSEAAAAMAGMVKFHADESNPKSKIQNLKSEHPLIAAHHVRRHHALRPTRRKILEAAGYEVIVFHATATAARRWNR